MEFVFKKNGIVLERLTELEAEEKEDLIKDLYANEQIQSLEISFLEGTKFKDVGDVVEYIFENDIKNLTFNLR